MQDNDELRQLFPDIKPMKGSPTLFTLNGIGLSMYGKRDVHEETGAYLKTRCICFVFIPLLALGAYRVVDADGDGWYFLGREPLSKFARTWNFAFVLGLCLLAGVGTYMDRVNSRSYRAQRLLTKARSAAQAGRLAAAIQHYEKAANIHTAKRPHTKRAIKTLIETQLPQASAPSVSRVFAYFGRQYPTRLIKEQPTLYTTGLKLAEKWQPKAPKVSLQILDVLAQIAPNRKARSATLKRQMVLLEKMLKGTKSAKLASRLALLSEQMERCRRCFALLQPYETTLGTSEGARLLGEQYARRRQYKRAHKLLAPYVSAHTRALHSAEGRYQRAVQMVRTSTINQLKRGRGPRKFYRRSFKNLPSKTRSLQILMYVQQQLRKSYTVAIQRRQLRKASKVVPVAMGLGIVKLQLARQSRDPARRDKRLREAEKVFLSIRGIAGRSDQYKLYLGQVYYWLGQQEKGKRLFDQLLRKRKRAPNSSFSSPGFFARSGIKLPPAEWPKKRTTKPNNPPSSTTQPLSAR